MSDSTEKKAQGMWDQAKGKTKETVGDLTNDESMQTEGKVDQMKGKVEKKTGDLQGKLDDMTDKDRRS